MVHGVHLHAMGSRVRSDSKCASPLSAVHLLMYRYLQLESFGRYPELGLQHMHVLPDQDGLENPLPGEHELLAASGGRRYPRRVHLPRAGRPNRGVRRLGRPWPGFQLDRMVVVPLRLIAARMLY